MVTTGKTGTAKDPIFIQDHGAPALYVDLVTELEVDEHDIVRVSFAAQSVNGDGQAKAVISVRIRMVTEVAKKLCRDLGKLEHW
ncbi:hypothetical protein CO661_14080 [Sinorhizobium fredii]|uniref:Uncharacterized protein n=1 Tax=Rhizobium fredii TaxID=380 RepID=A0A2A6LYJ9_RHIFR|nr:hypothetical protein [Sinorhizobium fredii]PDT47306.1 hypothetical protein CO661_14080 [Sinorhizobium fredii]